MPADVITLVFLLVVTVVITVMSIDMEASGPSVLSAVISFVIFLSIIFLLREYEKGVMGYSSDLQTKVVYEVVECLEGVLPDKAVVLLREEEEQKVIRVFEFPSCPPPVFP